ncbi:hypothetical protein RDV89_09180 [Nocardioides zeae]|uniref:Uncharacterized protein n=1 Tax=Nocardioides imazamoxiresistens TaxID=3231893 RepID=A0ABU3PVH2_9ACTN|nr:hypothetical protein [Nocardioides zeae]MDT9593238.1 hypothetical protein [Nocardioides zeae]
MTIIRRAGIALAATLVSLGAIGATSQAAHADTSWGMKKVSIVKTQPGQVSPQDTSWGMK